MSTEREAIKKDNELRLEMVRRGLWRCCLNCEHWGEYPGITDEQKAYNFCTKFNRSPPDEIIIIGCDKHEQFIPF